MIRDRPILGIGPTAFNKIYLYQRPRFNALSAYSILLEVAVKPASLACLFHLAVFSST